MNRKILDNEKFDINEFGERWRRARISAIRAALPDRLSHGLSVTEADWLRSSEPAYRDAILKNVFDNSRKLGLSVTKFLGLSWEISDLAEILPYFNLPCFQSQWRLHNSAMVLERAGCDSLKEFGSFGCDYWREALDGLVMGVGENERLARHRSAGHDAPDGDVACVDVLYSEEFTIPKVVTSTLALSESSGPGTVKSTGHKLTQKYGMIPPQVLEGLQIVSKKFQDMKVRLILEGLSEGKLYYRLEPESGVLCGAGGTLLHDSFTSEMKKLFPEYEIKDASPIAVYGGSI